MRVAVRAMSGRAKTNGGYFRARFRKVEVASWTSARLRIVCKSASTSTTTAFGVPSSPAAQLPARS